MLSTRTKSQAENTVVRICVCFSRRAVMLRIFSGANGQLANFGTRGNLYEPGQNRKKQCKWSENMISPQHRTFKLAIHPKWKTKQQHRKTYEETCSVMNLATRCPSRSGMVSTCFSKWFKHTKQSVLWINVVASALFDYWKAKLVFSFANHLLCCSFTEKRTCMLLNDGPGPRFPPTQIQSALFSSSVAPPFCSWWGWNRAWWWLVTPWVRRWIAGNSWRENPCQLGRRKPTRKSVHQTCHIQWAAQAGSHQQTCIYSGYHVWRWNGDFMYELRTVHCHVRLPVGKT